MPWVIWAGLVKVRCLSASKGIYMVGSYEACRYDWDDDDERWRRMDAWISNGPGSYLHLRAPLGNLGDGFFLFRVGFLCLVLVWEHHGDTEIVWIRQQQDIPPCLGVTALLNFRF